MASATKTDPTLGGQMQALALQTSPPAAQLVSVCQARQAEPAATGRQRRTWSAAALHLVASSWEHGFTVGQAHAALPPDATQLWPGSAQGTLARVEQTPVAVVQVTT